MRHFEWPQFTFSKVPHRLYKACVVTMHRFTLGGLQSTHVQHTWTRSTAIAAALVAIAAGRVLAQDQADTQARTPIVQPSLASRFTPNEQGVLAQVEVPDFQKHVSPLLGRLGCNGRACHGSFQGQGGFMLSLFGYDFDADHKALLQDDRKRVNTSAPLESLVLTKPIDDEMHEGGKRFEKGGWEYQVLKSWIEAGAPKKNKANPVELKLEQLEVTPREIVLNGTGDTASLRAIAVWNDGTREDVTGLCRFFSNDTAIAAIDEHGRIVAGDRGDTHVVVSYDNAVVPISVLRPAGPTGILKQQIANAKTEVDRLVLSKLDKLGIEPSALASDEEFFRRVSLDIAGTLPTSHQVRRFLEDSHPNKRQAVVESLLDSPGYAAFWTTFLCDITGNNDQQLQNFSYLRDTPSQQWYQWIYDRVSKNEPYDKIVEGIVTAVSRESGESYREYCEAMTKIAKDPSGKAFAERSDMMYYWARANQRTAEDRAISFAYAFCGVRIQCAQCHKHPFDQWSKKDFDLFERLFDGIQANQNSFSSGAKGEFESMIESLGIAKSTKGGQLARAIQDKLKQASPETVIPFPEVYVKNVAMEKQKDAEKKAKGKDKGKGKDKTPDPKPIPKAKLLGGEFVDLATVNDPRTHLMDWLRDKSNPYFARAIVNRVWAHYFQVGIVNPADDLNLANAASNEELLRYLEVGFVESGYDLKWLHRTIVNTDTYQRSWKTNATNEKDRRNFSHALLRRLPAETAYDALRIALSSDKVAQSMCNLEVDRAMTVPGSSAQSRNRGGGDKYALSVFGRSVRESNCDCDRTSDPSLLQTVYIRNDSDVLKALLDPNNSWLAQVARERDWVMPTTGPIEQEKKMSEASSMMMSGDADKDRKTLEDYDRRARSLRAQIAKLEGNESAADKRKDLTSRLALVEKRMAAHREAMSAKDKGEESQASGSQNADVITDSAKAAEADVQQLIEEAYLRTLSRKPTSDEVRLAVNAMQQAETPIRGLSDVVWALINSKEFILNH